MRHRVRRSRAPAFLPLPLPGTALQTAFVALRAPALLALPLPAPPLQTASVALRAPALIRPSGTFSHAWEKDYDAL